MGTSNWQNISHNIQIVRKLNPKTILDIGIGFGRWGILFREFLEIWENGKYNGKWDRIIDGVEIYKPYIQSYHSYFYSSVYNEDALEFMRKTENRYDLINCGDVIEHFTKKDGEELIRLCMQKGKYVLITIPIGRHWRDNPENGNPHEEHKSIWHNNDFTKYKYYKIKSFSDFTHRNYSVVLLSSGRIKFDKRFGRFFSIKNILKHKLGLKRLIESYDKRKRKN